MNVKIEINGNVDKTQELQNDIDNILSKYFKSFSFKWELKRGIEK